MLLSFLPSPRPAKTSGLEGGWPVWLPISLAVLCPGHMGVPLLSLHLDPLLSWPQEQLMALGGGTCLQYTVGV